MTYQLYIGDRTFSSWSLRGWLMFEKFGIPHHVNMMGLYAGTMASELKGMEPARTVPAMKTPEGFILSDSVAMAETLVERHPDVNFLPKDPAARALARNLIAEMHAGFGTLRNDCNMQVAHVWKGFQPSEGVKRDLARIEFLWDLARSRHGQTGPWLFGEYTLADVFYAPVAMRITGYDLPVSDAARVYVQNHLADRAIVNWRAEAAKEVHEPFPYPMPLEKAVWPL